MSKRYLSIDWDYFCNASMNDRVSLFPDGGNENLPASILDFIWIGRYASAKVHGKDITSIGLKTKEYSALKRFIKASLHFNMPTMIVNSHLHAYDFIMKNTKKNEKVEICNIDFHHDVYNVNGDRELNCGNWLYKLIKMGKVENATWVKAEDSDENIYKSKLYETTDIKEVLKGEYDGIFLCKSGVWSPPHLDKKFAELGKLIESNSYCLSEWAEGVFGDRYHYMKKQIDSMEEQEKEVMGMLNIAGLAR